MRQKMRRSTDRKVFRRTANRTKVANLPNTGSRGGIRL